MREPARPGSHPPGPHQHDDSLAVAITRPGSGTAVLGVHGEVDTLTAPQLTTALADLLACPEDVLVIDLTGVTFLASSGLAVLIQAAHRAEERPGGRSGARLRLVATSRAVQRPLEITGSDQLFDVYADLGSATAD